MSCTACAARLRGDARSFHYLKRIVCLCSGKDDVRKEALPANEVSLLLECPGKDSRTFKELPKQKLIITAKDNLALHYDRAFGVNDKAGKRRKR